MVHAQAATGFFDEGKRKGLTAQAKRAGSSFGAYLAYEEDCKYAIAFYERPDWYRSLLRANMDYWQKLVDEPWRTSFDSIRDEAPEQVANLAARIALSDADLIAETKLFETISAWDADYLLARSIQPEPMAYAHFIQFHKHMAEWKARTRANIQHEEVTAMQSR